MVGAPQLDDLVQGDVATPTEIARRYGIPVADPFLLVVQHPVTEELTEAGAQAEALCAALAEHDMRKVWILPNNDAGSHAVRQVLLRDRTRDVQVFDNLTRRDYLCLLKNSRAIVGNSSSGLLEAPTFGTPAVNIGRRQADRVQGRNVINAEFEVGSIRAAISRALLPEFRSEIQGAPNPYGDGHSSSRILEVLRTTEVDDRLLIKRLTY